MAGLEMRYRTDPPESDQYVRKINSILENGLVCLIIALSRQPIRKLGRMPFPDELASTSGRTWAKLVFAPSTATDKPRPVPPRFS
jgi:hypothetical protein